MIKILLGLLRTLPSLMLLTCLGPTAHAQNFWQTTRTAPMGPKLGLAATGDSTLITSVASGVLRTTNQGRSWTLALRSHHTYALHSNRNGRFLVGGAGKIYRSFDGGATWDSMAIGTQYPIVSILETQQGGLLVGAGTADLGGYVGDGVFFSADNGQTWTARNTGFGAARYVSHLISDRNGRIYAAVVDDASWRQAGLHISDDNGLNWQHLPVRIDGKNAIADNIAVHETFSLAISPQDSLLFSFLGVSTNVGVTINGAKSLADVANPNVRWTVQGRNQGGMWWNQSSRYRLHFARNGDWYSSRIGSVNTGGTLLSRDQGRNWELKKSGLGLSAGGVREPQQFAELPDGRIFMVQDFDDQVYFSNASIVTKAKHRQQSLDVALYPNPATNSAQLVNGTKQAARSIQLLALNGRVVRTYMTAPQQSSFTLDLSLVPAGVYVVSLVLADGQSVHQKLVKQ